MQNGWIHANLSDIISYVTISEFRRNEMGEDLSTVDDASLMEAIKRAVLDLDEIPLYTIKANTVKREEIPSSIEEVYL